MQEKPFHSSVRPGLKRWTKRIEVWEGRGRGRWDPNKIWEEGRTDRVTQSVRTFGTAPNWGDPGVWLLPKNQVRMLGVARTGRPSQVMEKVAQAWLASEENGVVRQVCAYPGLGPSPKPTPVETEWDEILPSPRFDVYVLQGLRRAILIGSQNRDDLPGLALYAPELGDPWGRDYPARVSAAYIGAGKISEFVTGIMNTAKATVVLQSQTHVDVHMATISEEDPATVVAPAVRPAEWHGQDPVFSTRFPGFFLEESRPPDAPSMSFTEGIDDHGIWGAEMDYTDFNRGGTYGETMPHGGLAPPQSQGTGVRGWAGYGPRSGGP